MFDSNRDELGLTHCLRNHSRTSSKVHFGNVPYGTFVWQTLVWNADSRAPFTYMPARPGEGKRTQLELGWPGSRISSRAMLLQSVCVASANLGTSVRHPRIGAWILQGCVKFGERGGSCNRDLSSFIEQSWQHSHEGAAYTICLYGRSVKSSIFWPQKNLRKLRVCENQRGPGFQFLLFSVAWRGNIEAREKGFGIWIKLTCGRGRTKEPESLKPIG